MQIFLAVLQNQETDQNWVKEVVMQLSSERAATLKDSSVQTSPALSQPLSNHLQDERLEASPQNLSCNNLKRKQAQRNWRRKRSPLGALKVQDENSCCGRKQNLSEQQGLNLATRKRNIRAKSKSNMAQVKPSPVLTRHSGCWSQESNSSEDKVRRVEDFNSPTSSKETPAMSDGLWQLFENDVVVEFDSD